MANYECIMALLNTIDNSMSLIAIVLEAVCYLQCKSICLHFWIGKKCKTSKYGVLQVYLFACN